MQENPFQAPTANVELLPAGDDLSVVPDKIHKKIRNAAVACLISAAITLVFALLAASGTLALAGFGLAQLVDVALILGLAFGIYKRSRICAVIMLVYFVISKVWLFRATGQFSGGFVALVFLYLYGQGVVGTFAFHKWKKRTKAEPVGGPAI